MDRLPVSARSEYEITHLGSKNCLLALRFIKRTNKRERLVNLAPQGTDDLTIDFVSRGLLGERDVEREMTSPELDHPRVIGGRLAEEGKAIPAFPKTGFPSSAFFTTSSPSMIYTTCS